MVTTTTLLVTSLVVAAASAAAGAYTSIEQGKAAEAAGKYNAAVGRNNAQMASDQARYEADRIRKKNMLILGRQRAQFAKGGIDVFGSPTDVMLDSASEGELDRMAALYTGDVSSTGYRARANLAEAEGRNAARTGYYNAGASILGGAGSATSAYGKYALGSSPSFEP